MRPMKELAAEYKRAFNLTDEQWISRQRLAGIEYAHRAFARHARKEGYTWREIGEAIGQGDHSSVLKLCKQDGWYEKTRQKYGGK